MDTSEFASKPCWVPEEAGLVKLGFTNCAQELLLRHFFLRGDIVSPAFNNEQEIKQGARGIAPGMQASSTTRGFYCQHHRKYKRL